MNFSVTGSHFHLYAHTAQNIGYDFYAGFVDDNTFSFYNGSIPTETSKCYTRNPYHPDDSVNEFQYCTTFVPAPQAPANSPRCKTFKSVLSLLYSNYSTIATSVAIYELNQELLSVNGTFTAPENYSISYDVNEYGMKWEFY